MFYENTPNLIESDEGFSVEVLGRTGLLYREGGRIARIDSEVLAGPSGIIVYSDSCTDWLASGSRMPITEAEKSRLLENIRRAFRYQGFEIQVQ